MVVSSAHNLVYSPDLWRHAYSVCFMPSPGWEIWEELILCIALAAGHILSFNKK